MFQCHHGVPASPRYLVVGCNNLDSFNATTAFLLLEAFKRAQKRFWGFNATTAFLLLCVRPCSVGYSSGFNATTAFLLRILAAANPPEIAGFNATTAFLLLFHIILSTLPL